MLPPPPKSTLFPYTTLFRSNVKLLSKWLHNESGSKNRSYHIHYLAIFNLAPLIICIGIDHLRGFSCRKTRSEEHTSELQSHVNLVCRLLLEKKKKQNKYLCY